MGTRVKSRVQSGGRRRHFIQEWREYRELTQAQLAEKIGVSISTISQLENSKQGYSQATLEALADALMCQPADLLKWNPLVEDDLRTIWESPDHPARRQLAEIAKTFSR
jgi:transcriptional regulator with XRE-family HTH domain